MQNGYTHHTKEDIDFVLSNRLKMSIKEMADLQNMTEDTVRYIISAYAHPNEITKKYISDGKY